MATQSGGGGAYVVTPLQEDDLDAVARLHVAGFGDAFLATLGVPFLRHYYRTFLDYPEGCALVARRGMGGAAVGFVCGTEDVTRHYRLFLLRHLLLALPVLVTRAVREPRIVLGVLRRLPPLGAIVGRHAHSRPGTPVMSLPSAHLMSMAVAPAHRGRGVGEVLVEAFVDEMARRGVPRLMLGVRDGNVPARRLYERTGWRPVLMERAHDGSASWIYVRDLIEPARDAEQRLQPRA